MAVSLPDIIGEYINTPTRFETGGVQFAGYFEPPKIAPEQVGHLFLFLQNILNAQLTVNFMIHVPQTKGLFSGGQPMLSVQNPTFQLKLDVAEAGLLTLPFTTTEHVKSGEHLLTIELKVKVEGRPERVRPPKSESQLDTTLIDSPVGLNLVSCLGSTYTEQSVRKASFPFEVTGQPAPPERAPRLTHKYQTIWVPENMNIFNQAIHELNEREVKLNNELGVEALYATLYAESTLRFADAGLPLRIGESIILSKILTYSCQYFLSDPYRRHGLLVPIWERALGAEVDTTDALEVIRTIGFHHLLRLAIALSFGLMGKAVKHQAWSFEERQAVINYISNSLEEGQELEVDFLYLPLLIAGTLIYNKLRLNGEDVQQSLALLKKAYDTRSELFAEDDMAQASNIFNRILSNALKQS